MASRKNVLEIINDNSLVLYCLIKNKKFKINDLYEAVLTRNKELILEKIIPVSDKKIKTLKKVYTKENCLDEILYLTDNKYKHLKDIRYIVNINTIIETVITEKIYLKKLRIHYTDLIIDLLVEKFYDYESLQLFSNLKKKIIEIDSNINKEIIENIDKYYIKKITI